MKADHLFALLGAIISAIKQTIAAPTDVLATPVLEKRTPAWQFYYGVTAAEHQTKFNQFSSEGYQMISLSAYGQPPNNVYAAVWVQRSGPSYYAIHQATASQYQSFFDTYAAKGYVSTIITVTGPASGPIFSGIMVQNGVSNWYQKCGLTQLQYSEESSTAQTSRYILKSFTEYGTTSDRLYCGLWYANDQFDKYTTFYDETYSEYQSLFNSETTKPFWRPSCLAVSEDHLISAEFTDTDVGSWVARHGMTAADLQSEYETQLAAGLYIIHLQGGGTGSNANYAALWAEHDIPTPRSWRAIGTVSGFTNNAQAESQADTLMQTFMQTNGVRQAQFSVGKNGNIILERAYSWSESTRPTTEPTDIFLLASISKMFLEAVIQILFNDGKLESSTKAYPLLGYSNPPDARLTEITIQDLLDHYGGLDDSISGFDPAYNMGEIAIAEGTQGAPATIKNIVDYMFQQPLQHDPGTVYAYSNYGYILLSYVVEKVTGTDYYSYLSSAVLQPGGYDVQKWVTSPAAHVNDRITQESQYTGWNAAEPLSTALIADIFGGDGMYKEDDFGGCALAASASTLVDFIHTHAVWGNGGRSAGSAREGSTPGTETFAESITDGLDWSVVVNTRDWPPYAPNQEPFGILTDTTVPNFLNTNPAA